MRWSLAVTGDHRTMDFTDSRSVQFAVRPQLESPLRRGGRRFLVSSLVSRVGAPLGSPSGRSGSLTNPGSSFGVGVDGAGAGAVGRLDAGRVGLAMAQAPSSENADTRAKRKTHREACAPRARGVPATARRSTRVLRPGTPLPSGLCASLASPRMPWRQHGLPFGASFCGRYWSPQLKVGVAR